MTYTGKAPIPPVTLSFKLKKLQRDYSKYYVERSLQLIRIGLMLGMALYMLYSLLDRFIVPQMAPQIFIIRIFVSLFFNSAINHKIKGDRR